MQHELQLEAREVDDLFKRLGGGGGEVDACAGSPGARCRGG